MNSIKLLAETPDTVTISRADLNALIEAAEITADLATVRAQRADEAAAGGYEAAKAGYYTADEAKRILAGESPVRVWRQKRGLTQRALAGATNIQPGYLSEIENGKKPGSVAAYQALALALEVRLDDLVG
jgi:DNA-binding XRE family transcriptional regulator